MNWSNYSTLKSAGSVSFAKQKQTTREAVAEVKAVDAVEWEGKPTDDNTVAEIKSFMDTNSIDYSAGDSKSDLLGKIPAYKKDAVPGVPGQPKEEREYVAMVSKQWNSATGEALADSSREYSLSDLEREKERYDRDMAQAKAQSDELAKAIADFKKV